MEGPLWDWSIKWFRFERELSQ